MTSSNKITISPIFYIKTIIKRIKSPIFIIGAPRSGTSFLGDCVKEIPGISYHREPLAIKRIIKDIHHKNYNLQKVKLLYNLIYKSLMIFNHRKYIRFAEKTPQNCFVIDYLLKVFPDAQFIHIIRDGRDASLSYSKKPWLQNKMKDSGLTEPGGYLFGPFARYWVDSDRIEEFETTNDLHRCIWGWKKHVESVLERTDLTQNRQQYLEVRYEELIRNYTTEGKRILKFLHIYDIESEQKFIGALSKSHSRSIGKWKSELSFLQVETIINEAGQLLKILKYI